MSGKLVKLDVAKLIRLTQYVENVKNIYVPNPVICKKCDEKS